MRGGQDGALGVGPAVGDARKQRGERDAADDGGASGVSNLFAAAVALGDAILGRGWVVRSVLHNPDTARPP